MPFFNFNSFSAIPFFQNYNTLGGFPAPSIWNIAPPQFGNITNTFSNIQVKDYNSWSNITPLSNWDTIEFSHTPTRETKNNILYNSQKDINAAKNKTFIDNLNKDMQERTKKLIAYANQNGYDVEIISGYRTEEKQKELQEKYKNETGRVAKNSAHCAGKAIDIKVTKNGCESNAGYNLLANYAKKELNMRWGGDFTTYRERWHFDYNWA